MEEFYCSNCNNAVNKNDLVCVNCGADLSKIIDDIDEQCSVIIKTYINFIEAETAQEFLRQSGIDSFISKDDAGGMYPHHFGGINSYRLVVLESNAEDAVKILNIFEKGNNINPFPDEN